eukprot:15366381-Ditylum_brightwellii.AAC.2
MIASRKNSTISCPITPTFPDETYSNPPPKKLKVEPKVKHYQEVASEPTPYHVIGINFGLCGDCRIQN